MTRMARRPLRLRVRERDEGGTTSRPQPLPPGSAARQVAERTWRCTSCAAGCAVRGGTVACTCLPRLRGRLTRRARNAMANTIARVPMRTRPRTRMLRSISPRKAAGFRADAFLRAPGQDGLEHGARTGLRLGTSSDEPRDCFSHRRRVGPALPGDVE